MRRLWLVFLVGCGGAAPGLSPDGGGVPDGRILADGGLPDAAPPCDDPSDCGDGELCLADHCVTSRCNDGVVDPARGEQCDTGPGCDGECHFLPCPPRACTTTARDDQGACAYTPVENGLPCEDGDACTASDHCEAGACVGSAIAQAPSTQGAVMTYGAEPVRDWDEGLASFVGPDRLVFLESTKRTTSRLSLVRLGDTGLERLDEVDSRIGYLRVIRSFVYWGTEPLTYLLPMTENRVVVLTSDLFAAQAGLEVFDLDGDRFTLRGYTPLPVYPDPSALVLNGAVAREDAVFVCGEINLGRSLRSYTYDDLTGSFTLAAELATPSGGCNDLALSPDGSRLYLAANGGYRVYDVTDPTRFVVPDKGHVVLLPDHVVEDLDLDADHIVARTMRVAGDFDDIFVFQPDGTLVGPVARPAGLGANARPFGMALAGPSLYVEWAEGVRTVVARHDFSTAQVLRDYPAAGYPGGGVALAARGDAVVLQPWRRVLRGDTELTGVGQGSLRALLPAGPGQLVAVGPSSTQRIDVTDPAAPRLVSGGMSAAPTGGDRQLILPEPGGEARLMTSPVSTFKSFTQTQPREHFTLYDAALTRLGRGAVDGPRDGAAFGFNHGQLFQVVAEGNLLHIRRFSAANLIGLDGVWPADLERLIPDVDVPDHPRIRVSAVGVSPSGEDVLIVTLRITQGSPSAFVYAATWLHVTQGDLTVVARGIFETVDLAYAVDFAFVGDTVFALGDEKIVRASHHDGVITVDAGQTRPPGAVTLWQRILRADHDHVYVTRHDWKGSDATADHIWAVDVLSAGDLSTTFSHPTPDEVQSITAMGTHLYFGMNAGLVVATPACSVTPLR